jgi:hypothetical protein
VSDEQLRELIEAAPFTRHVGHDDDGGDSDCAACWLAELTIALNKERPMTAHVACQSCPIEMTVEQFVDAVAGGWGMQHNFQRPEFNDGQVIVCRGRFRLKGTPAAEEGGVHTAVGGER